MAARSWSYHCAMTVGCYADMPLQDELGIHKCGAVFMLRQRPVQDAVVQLGGWSVEIKHEVRAVAVHGGARSRGFSEAFSVVLEAANNGLDFMSFRGLADVAIRDATDDCLVWWPENGAVVLRANVIHTMTSHHSARVVVHDADGNVVPSSPPTPLQRDAFRFIRMSRTSEYLHDAYRNMFLALESVISEIHPHASGREAAWFKDALSEADRLEPVSSLAPPGVSDAIDWIYNNMYSDERSGLMHAKAGRQYLLPQETASRASMQESLGRLSTYVL